MNPIPLYENPIEVLRTRVTEGAVRATPLCVAVIGWLCDFAATEPRILGIERTSDGQLLARLSDDALADEFLGSEVAFLEQIRVICDSLGMSRPQTRQVLREARRRLG